MRRLIIVIFVVFALYLVYAACHCGYRAGAESYKWDLAKIKMDAYDEGYKECFKKYTGGKLQYDF